MKDTASSHGEVTHGVLTGMFSPEVGGLGNC